jgi:hypothetical protein
MKLLSRALLLWLCLAAPLVPTVSIGDELPIEQKVSPGTAYLTYEGQTFRITTTTTVEVRFEKISPSLIRIEFIAAAGSPGKISVYWLNFDKAIYNGLVPLEDPWSADLNTEGGFIDR